MDEPDTYDVIYGTDATVQVEHKDDQSDEELDELDYLQLARQ
jgi:hypothetical protein